MAAGTKLNLLMPLGNGFFVEENEKKDALVGGGVGVFPLISVLREYGKSKEIDLVVDKYGAESEGNGSGRIIMTTDDDGRSEVHIHADTIKFHVTKEFGVYSNNVGMFNILYNNGNGYNDPTNSDITRFNYSMNGTRSNNPLNGYINHALWS
jgi:hypothetical protein